MANLGGWRADWAGSRIAGRVVDGYLRPYHDRRAIRAGALAGKAKVLAWADPVDAFFLQIQGSGIARLPNGGTWRLAYDGHNGHRYVAIGRELIAEGAIARADMSMQAIEKWLRANPERAAEMMARNPSFIFFRRRQGPGPIGAAGVPLTAGRSLAIDTRYVPFEAPVWLDLPELRRLMVAQDRGGAIKGAVRGDVFWGSGHGGRRPRRRDGRPRRRLCPVAEGHRAKPVTETRCRRWLAKSLITTHFRCRVPAAGGAGEGSP